jgi:hypothetical protein
MQYKLKSEYESQQENNINKNKTRHKKLDSKPRIIIDKK